MPTRASTPLARASPALTTARQWRAPPPEVVLAEAIHGLLRIGGRFRRGESRLRQNLRFVHGLLYRQRDDSERGASALAGDNHAVDTFHVLLCLPGRAGADRIDRLAGPPIRRQPPRLQCQSRTDAAARRDRRRPRRWPAAAG